MDPADSYAEMAWETLMEIYSKPVPHWPKDDSQFSLSFFGHHHSTKMIDIYEICQGQTQL